MNTQKPLPLVSNSADLISLHSIFPTIQGEGIFAGHPAIFVRLAGCNLKCPACDTEYTDGARDVSVNDIIKMIENLNFASKLIVITGGEPFRQDLNLLISTLIFVGYKVQIETNGTLAPCLSYKLLFNGNLFVVCSPKSHILNEQLIPFISAYKYVVNADHVNLLNGLPTQVLGLKVKGIAYPPAHNEKPVYVQPMDSKNDAMNKRHLDATVQSVLKYGYTLCLQLHKIINVE